MIGFKQNDRWRAARWALGIGIVLAAGCQPDAGTDPAQPIPSLASAPILITNARIYTMDAGDTLIASGAMAFSADGEILGIGDSEPMANAFPAADPVDLEGRTVLPGLIDGHGHLYGLALAYTQADLVGTTSTSDVLERLRRFAADLPEGDWLLGHGWDQNDWPEPVFPGREDLDAEFPDRPVWLVRIDGHAGWANSAALARADRDLGGDWQEPGGHVHRDEQGQPTGILVDKSMAHIDRAVPATPEDLIDAAPRRPGAAPLSPRRSAIPAAVRTALPHP